MRFKDEDELREIQKKKQKGMALREKRRDAMEAKNWRPENNRMDKDENRRRSQKN